MLSNERNEFESILSDVMELSGRTVSANASALWWETFKEYTLSDIRQAFTKFIKAGGFLNPAEVLKFIPNSQGITADQAWSHVPKYEHESAWVTQRMMTALVCATPEGGFINDYDVKSARKAFIDFYHNLPEDSKFFYSSGTGMKGLDYETKQSIKLQLKNKVEDLGWKKKTAPKLLSEKTENGLESSKKASNKKAIAELRSTMKEMLGSSLSDSTQD